MKLGSPWHFKSVLFLFRECYYNYCMFAFKEMINFDQFKRPQLLCTQVIMQRLLVYRTVQKSRHSSSLQKHKMKSAGFCIKKEEFCQILQDAQ